MSYLRCGQYLLPLERPLVMGIVNLTPDSFSGDGLVGDIDRAISHARAQFEAGAHILDIGAESSRPGAFQPRKTKNCAAFCLFCVKLPAGVFRFPLIPTSLLSCVPRLKLAQV